MNKNRKMKQKIAASVLPLALAFTYTVSSLYTSLFEVPFAAKAGVTHHH